MNKAQLVEEVMKAVLLRRGEAGGRKAVFFDVIRSL